MADIGTMLLLFAPSLLYAVAGLIDAYNKKEQISWPTFLKTLIVGAVSAGLISQTQADMLTQFASSTLIMYLLDKLLNAIIRKGKVTLPPQPPSVSGSAP